MIVYPFVQAEELKADTTRAQLALPNVYEAEAPRAITEEEKNFDAFLTLRRVRADKRNAGQRKKRADAVSTIPGYRRVLRLLIRYDALAHHSRICRRPPRRPLPRSRRKSSAERDEIGGRPITTA